MSYTIKLLRSPDPDPFGGYDPGYPSDQGILGEPRGTGGGVSGSGGGGGGLLGALGIAANIYNTNRQNKKNREFAEQQANQQRQWSMDDWYLQNEYNSPTSQMARLREAGLNPNLVYGKGADNTSQAVRSSPPASYQGKAAQIDLPAFNNTLMTHMDLKMKTAQIDNLKVQNTVLEQEAALKAATTASTTANTARSTFDLGMSQELKTNSLEMASESLRKLKTGTDVQLQENERAAAQNSANLKTAAETILNMRAARANTEAERQNIRQQLHNLEATGKLQDMDIQLRKMGIQPSDNLFFRVLGRLLNGDLNNLPELPKSMRMRDTVPK